MRLDYAANRQKIASRFKMPDFITLLRVWHVENTQSLRSIADRIKREGLTLSARSLQRIARQHGIVRPNQYPCRDCKELTAGLQIHHTRYGDDITIADLKLLCRRCHNKEHGKDFKE